MRRKARYYTTAGILLAVSATLSALGLSVASGVAAIWCLFFFILGKLL